jgi:thymidine kinase
MLGGAEFTGGSVTCFVGPMFAGKTSAMLAEVTRFRLAGRAAVIVVRVGADRPELGRANSGGGDAEGEGEVDGLTRLTSHSPHLSPVGDAPASGALAAVRVIAAVRLADVVLREDELAVGVDEGQFFDDLAEAAGRWADEGRAVVVAALDGDFMRAPFAPVAALLPLCDASRVVKVAGVCGDCRTAPSSFTRRIVAGDSVVLVGGADKYVAVCRGCYSAIASSCTNK